MSGINGAPRPETLDVDETAILAHFTALFGSRRGYVGILSGERNGKKLKGAVDRAYPWPASAPALAGYVAQEVAAGREVYACGHVLTRQRRIKENAAPMGVLYVDGDGATLPATVPPPTYTVHSSPGREQWYWHLTVDVDPERGEQLNRRLAYAIGADKGGWDLTQALRIPGTPNRKYDGLPIVRAEQPTGATYDPDELDRLLPPAPPIAPRPTTVTNGPGDDAGDEPPVELDVAGLAVWRGERRKVKPDGSGEIDRSDTLWWLACELREAGATQRTITAATAERDAAWGWGCYADRPGEYDRLATKVVAKITPGPRSAPADQPTTSHSPTDQTDQPTDLCAGVRDELAALRAELAEARRTIASIVQTVMNPYMSLADMRTQVSTLSLAEHKRSQGEVRPDGSVELSASEIGSDWRPEPERGQPLPPTNPNGDKPRLPRETVRPTIAKLAERGLLRVRTEPKKQTRKDGSTYNDTVFIVEPPTRLSDAFAASATWRPADPKPRKPRTQRQPCPHCHEVHPLKRTDACTGCGSVVATVVVLPPLVETPAADPPLPDKLSETPGSALPVVRPLNARKTIGHGASPARLVEPAHLFDAPDPDDPFADEDPPPRSQHHHDRLQQRGLHLPPLRVPYPDRPTKPDKYAGLPWAGD